MKQSNDFFSRYSHSWVFLYLLIYLPWFTWLERTYAKLSDCNIIHTALDDKIPFCEYFVIPYFLWFLYVPLVILILFFTSKKEFYQTCGFLFGGMTICLLICTFFPNGQNLRQYADLTSRDNIFIQILSALYKTDTDTNVFPSIHVFNSIGIHIAVMKGSFFANKKWIKLSSFILCVLIILSTMFLKQHSVLDGIGAGILAVIMYCLVYVFKWSFSANKEVVNE